MSEFFLIFTQLIFGAGIYQLFSRDEKIRVAHCIFGYPLGAYLFTQAIFFGGILGLPLTAKSYMITSAFLAGIITSILYFVSGGDFVKAPWRFKNSLLSNVKGKIIQDLPFLSIFSISILFGSLCLFYTQYTTDSFVNYFGKGSIISIDKGLILENLSGTTGLITNPLFLPLQYASFLASGSKLPDVIFGIYYIITAVAIFHTISQLSPRIRYNHNAWIAFGCAIMFATAPAALIHSTAALANLAYTMYFFLSITLIVIGIKKDKVGLIYLSSVMYSGAIWTYSQGLFHYLAPFLVVALWALKKNRMRIVLISFLLTMLLSIPWPVYRMTHWKYLEKAFYHDFNIEVPSTIIHKMLPYFDLIWITFYSAIFLALIFSWNKLIKLYKNSITPNSITTSLFLSIMIVLSALSVLSFAVGNLETMGKVLYDLFRLMIWRNSWGILFISCILSVFLFKRNSWGGVVLGIGGLLFCMTLLVLVGAGLSWAYSLPEKLTNIFYGANRHILPLSAVLVTALGILLSDIGITSKSTSWVRFTPTGIMFLLIIVHLLIVPPIPSRYYNMSYALNQVRSNGLGDQEVFFKIGLTEPLYSVAKWMAKNTNQDSLLVLSKDDYPKIFGRLKIRLIKPIIYPRRIVVEDFDPVVCPVGGDDLTTLKAPDKHRHGYRLYYDENSIYMAGEGEVERLIIKKDKWVMPKVDCREG